MKRVQTNLALPDGRASDSNIFLLNFPFSFKEEFLSIQAMNTETTFEKFLNQQNDESWSATLATLLRSIHEVDRNATQIWFAFYPLSLFQALTESDDREKLVQQLLLQGDYELKDQIDRAHTFLYGHRFWPQVKKAVEQHAEEWDSARVGGGVLGVEETSNQSIAKNSLTTAPSKLSSQHPTPKTLHPTASLADQILSLARRVANDLKKDESLLVGITAVAFMTLQQTGLAAFKAAPGAIHLDRKHANKSPEQILR